MAKAQQYYRSGQLAEARAHWQFAKNEVAAQCVKERLSPTAAKRVDPSIKYVEEQQKIATDWYAVIKIFTEYHSLYDCLTD